MKNGIAKDIAVIKNDIINIKEDINEIKKELVKNRENYSGLMWRIGGLSSALALIISITIALLKGG